MKYSRQEKLKFIPVGFSKTVKNKRIVLVGSGGIGSVLCELLIRGGFLNLVLIDNDLIDETNLQRQNFEENDIGEFKSIALKKKLEKIDSNAKIEAFCTFLNEENISKICSRCDLIIDCTDNFETRYIINDYCIKNKKDWIYNGAIKTQFTTCIFYSNDNSFKKIFPQKIEEEKCCEVGILASSTFACACVCYNEVLKYFLGIKEKKLIKYDLWENKLFNINTEIE